MCPLAAADPGSAYILKNNLNFTTGIMNSRGNNMSMSEVVAGEKSSNILIFFLSWY